MQWLVSSFQTPSATMLIKCSWWTFCSEVVMCCDIWWYWLTVGPDDLRGNNSMILRSTFCLNSDSAPSASHWSPAPAICFLPSCHMNAPPHWHKAAAELHFPARWAGFPTNQKPTATDLAQLIAFCTPMKQKQSQSLRKTIPRENWKPKWKYPAETRHDYPCLSVQGRKSDTKTADICYTAHSTTYWEEMKMFLKREQNCSTNSQEEASIETHPCQN